MTDKLFSDQIIDHYTGHDNYQPEYCKPSVTPDFWCGVLYALLFCVPFWGILIALAWIANVLIGG